MLSVSLLFPFIELQIGTVMSGLIYQQTGIISSG